MKNKLKLWLRRLALRWLRKLVDLADDYLHTAEVKLRGDLAAGVVPVKQSPAGMSLASRGAFPTGRAYVPSEMSGSASRRRVSFLEWEARRTGVAVISKKEARRRRERVSASAFDLRFAR